MPDLLLAGCQPEPLGSYLKAIGTLRLVANHLDASASGWWTPDGFTLRTQKTEEELVAFFLQDYAPSPILTPWNGAGGFFFREGKNKDADGKRVRDKGTKATDATTALRASQCDRLQLYRDTIAQMSSLLEQHGITESPKNEAKHAFVMDLRDTAPDSVVEWLDAVVMVGEEKNSYPPLLGTGGCDGALDFANNFQQRLVSVMDYETGAPTAAAAPWLRAALFAEATPELLYDVSVGQFDPGANAGYNSGEGYEAKSVVNPWDYILAFEGTLLMAASATRRLESTGPGALSYPFSVRGRGVGAASSAGRGDEDSGRDEIWLPLWERPTSYTALRRLFAEGRATVGRRPAKDAVDFARAVATLGVDRGITAFTRYGFLQRRGLGFLAAPLGRWTVRHRPQVELIDSHLDRWIGWLHGAAGGSAATATLRAASNAVDRAVIELTRSQQAYEVQTLLIALAQAQGVVSRSPGLKERIRPCPSLDPSWARHADDGSPEIRLAAALANAGILERVFPIKNRNWAKHKDADAVWAEGSVVDNLLRVLRRDEIQQRRPVLSEWGTTLADINAFILGEVDDRRLAQLIPALALVRAPRTSAKSQPTQPPPLFGLMAVAWIGPTDPALRASYKLPQEMISWGAAGDSWRATQAAIRRLQANHRVRFRVGRQRATPQFARRATAALAFPLSISSVAALADTLFIPREVPS